MTDVFVSYAAEDRERAARLAGALTALGWTVWWDRRILAGQTFDKAIERELYAAKSVVVLWSRHSVESEWVKCEAAAAAERDVLVPAAIDKVRLPLEFSRRQTADLVRWRGESEHPGYRMLCEGLAAKIGCEVPLPVAASERDGASGTLPPETIRLERPETLEGSFERGAGRRVGWRTVGIAVGVLAIAGIVAALLIPGLNREAEPQPAAKSVPPADSAAVRPAEPPHEAPAGAARSQPTAGSASSGTGQTGAAKAPSSAAPPATKPKPPQGTASAEDCRMDALRRLQQGEINTQKYKELVGQCR